MKSRMSSPERRKPRPPKLASSAAPVILRNGLARSSALPQVFEPQQHREHPFQLSVEVDLVAAEPFQFVGIKRLTERMLPDQRPIFQVLLLGPQQRQHL